MENTLITIGYHKGELDFGVNTEISNLTREQLFELRSTVITAIVQAENMWARANAPMAYEDK